MSNNIDDDATYLDVRDPETKKSPKCKKCNVGGLHLDNSAFGTKWKLTCDHCNHSFEVLLK